MTPYEEHLRKLAERLALSSKHRSELTSFEHIVANSLEFLQLGTWEVSPMFPGEQIFMRKRPYYCDYMEEQRKGL